MNFAEAAFIFTGGSDDCHRSDRYQSRALWIPRFQAGEPVVL